MKTLDTTLLETVAIWESQGLSKTQISTELSRHLRTRTFVEPSYKLPKTQRHNEGNIRKLFGIKVYVWCIVICPIFLSVLFAGAALTLDGFIENILENIHGTPCVVNNNLLVSEIVRPHFNCDTCRGLKSVDTVFNISRQDFIEKYAFSGVPLLVKNGAGSWSAMKTFSFYYFKETYENYEHIKKTEKVESDAPEEDDKYECQFFPYKTEFSDLKEALAMPKERAEYRPGQRPWYFGWSNCQPSVQEELRRHYQRPYFLPEDTESSSIDWMFMGGHGLGAFMHIDNVDRPSWQAQITGSKTWELAPPVECESVCQTINATMEKGDIIVVDTNQWYHATHIHSGDISITIGSEFE